MNRVKYQYVGSTLHNMHLFLLIMPIYSVLNFTYYTQNNHYAQVQELCFIYHAISA